MKKNELIKLDNQIQEIRKKRPEFVIGCDFANGNDTTVIVRHYPDGTMEVVHASIKEISDIIGEDPIEAKVSATDRLRGSWRRMISNLPKGKRHLLVQETIILKEK